MDVDLQGHFVAMFVAVGNSTDRAAHDLNHPISAGSAPTVVFEDRRISQEGRGARIGDDHWAQDLEGTGVTVNALLPEGATLTGMVPQTVSEKAKSALLDPSIMVPPLLWLVSSEADGMTGRRLVATKWQAGGDGQSAAEAATGTSGLVRATG